jgi:(5-formylfuran-3-yl)methyl phosphate transaminase
MFIMFAALLEPNDQVIISDPHYACYPNFIKFLDAQPVMVKVFEEDGFQYRPEAIKKKSIKKQKRSLSIHLPILLAICYLLHVWLK